MSYPSFSFPSFLQQTQTGSGTTKATPVDADWHVLVLYADDTEKDLKGIWGPYSSIEIATLALEELRMWPIDGRWDCRRLNKFVALKAATQDQLTRFTWQS